MTRTHSDSQDRDHSQVRDRIDAQYDFFQHIVMFIVVMPTLIVINLFTSPGHYWFVWPLFGWGLAIAMHGIRVFLFRA